MKAKNFEKYIEDWFYKYLKDHEDGEKFYLELLTFMGFRQEDLDDCQTPLDGLLGMKAGQIWDRLFGYKNRHKYLDDQEERFDDIPYDDIYRNLLKQCFNVERWSFAEDFIDTMAADMSDYDTPLGYFRDMANDPNFVKFTNGMSNNRQCLETYGLYSNDLEKFRKYIVNLGLADEEEADNPEDIDHYIFMDWFCYEKLGMLIASVLYSNEF